MRRTFLAPLAALTLMAQAPAPGELQKMHDLVLLLLARERPEADQVLALMEKSAPTDPLTLDARKRLDASMKTRPGQPAPAFSIPNLEDPGAAFTLDTFKGKTVLLEFWATWCPYCVAELPGLHKAWDRYKDRGLEILSLSLDHNPEAIPPFRKARYPMPWQHAFLPGAKAHPIAQAYGASGIPKYVLVGPDGRILAAGSSLRGTNLEPTLARFLGK